MTLRASDFLEDSPDGEAELLADRLQVLLPVGTVDSIDTLLLEMEDRRVSNALAPVGNISNEARSQMDNLVQVVRVEGVTDMLETVVHLSSTLRVTDVEDLVFASGLLDSSNICSVVIETHISPGPVPVLTILG